MRCLSATWIVSDGSDTWVPERWQRYGEIMVDYRGWLAQLPPAVVRKIAYGSAHALFALK